MPKSEDLSRSLEINAIWTFDTEFPTIFNKSCTYITFKSAVKHRQLGYGYPRGYIIISPNSGCKWVKYSILWCQPCQNSFIWTYFPISYTNKTIVYVPCEVKRKLQHRYKLATAN